MPDAGVEVRLHQLHEWRPEDPGPFVATLKETGASPLRVHLSVVCDGHRIAGGLLSSLGQLDAGGDWLVPWLGLGLGFGLGLGLGLGSGL